MPSNVAGGSIQITRSNLWMAILKSKMEEESKKQADTMIKDPTSAAAFLINSKFKSEDDEMTFELLSIIAMQLSQQARTPKLASEAFKALSYCEGPKDAS